MPFFSANAATATFSKQINAFLALFLAAGLAAVGLYSYHSFNNERAHLLSELLLQARFTAASSQARFDDIGNDMDLAGLQLKMGHDRTTQQRFFNTLLAHHPEISDLTVFDAAGTVIYDHVKGDAAVGFIPPAAHRLHLLQAMQKPDIYSIDKDDFGYWVNEWRIPIRHAVRDAQGRPRFLIQVSLPIRHETALWQGLQLMPQTAIGLIGDNGQMIARYPDSQLLHTYAISYVHTPLYRAIQSHPVQGWFQGIGKHDAFARIGAYARLPHLPMTAFVSLPVRVIWTLWWKHNAVSFLTFGGAFFILFGAAALLLRREQHHHLELLDQAATDALTGLPNRTAVETFIQQKIERANEARQSFAVLFLDLNRFKGINDTLGHAMGDRVIKEAARRFRLAMREHDFLARLSADNFVAVVECDSGDKAEAAAQRLIKAMHTPVQIQTHSFALSMAIGVSLYPTDGRTVAELMRQADMAMHSIKNGDRNEIGFYMESMARQALQRMTLTQQLRVAIDEEQFVLHYQPKFDRDRRIVSVEALIRWNHPQRGLVPPGEFIPLAEASGMILEMGRWTLQAACRQAARWEADGRRLKMAVNLSAREFSQADLVDRIRAALATASLSPHLLELEITESMLADDFGTMLGRLNELVQSGLKIALDDFGTGYSSLSYLKQLPIDTVKIDRSFVRDIGKSAHDNAIITAIIDLCHRLGLRIVAEGVETEAQLDFLTRYQCHEFQGFLLSRPLPLHELEILLEKTEPVPAER